jgi:hypothetical protein
MSFDALFLFFLACFILGASIAVFQDKYGDK